MLCYASPYLAFLLAQQGGRGVHAAVEAHFLQQELQAAHVCDGAPTLRRMDVWWGAYRLGTHTAA
jgi:hypothetical protein